VKVLIADDTRMALLVTTRHVSACGHEILTAGDGTEAVERFLAAHPDLVLLDVEMPGMDGYEAARRIRQICAERDDWIPIVFLSGKVADEDVMRGIEAGGDDYLTKPVNPTVLRAKLKAMERIAEMRTRLAAANDELRRLSNLDGLTGIANRRSFDATLAAEWKRAARAGSPVSLLLCDVDHFKRYNDRYGHLAGDECLKHVATALSSLVERAGDLVARYGGEEFAVILPATDGDGSLRLADVLRSGVEALRIPATEAELPWVTVSAGVATAVPAADDPDSAALLRAADAALYRAKRAGRNRVCGPEHGTGATPQITSGAAPASA
jgi:diguanylate cyclase (GGDEF)-like protein